jgi:uncharacterized membrane protein YcaP (DUF421 family)
MTILATNGLDWGEMFGLDVPLVEIFLRGTFVYLGVFLLLRVVLRRQSGTISTTDLLLIVLIADASQNAMTSEYRSVTSGMILVATLLFWDYVLDWVAFHVPSLRVWIHPNPLVLVEHGRVNEGHLAKELLAREQLESKLREHGIEKLSEVRKAYLEGDGRISVITKSSNAQADEDDEQPHA